MLSSGDPAALRLELRDDAAAKIRAGVGPERGERVLVLGGTGFVGVHLVHRLLSEDMVQEVVTIARPGRDGTSPLERVVAAMRHYELDAADVRLDRLTCLEGRLAGPSFGLADSEHARLVDEIDAVFQCAGSTDYSASYLDLREDWVMGLLAVVDFCLTRKLKHLTYLGSTIAHLYREPDDFRRPDSWWYSGYAQMKWVNQAMLAALARQGLPVSVCEAPYVLGSTAVGKDPGLHYSFWRAAAVARALELIWDGPGLGFVPIDVLVGTLVANIARPDPLTVLRPAVPERYAMRSIASLLGCEVVSWLEFHDVVSKIDSPQLQAVFPADLPEIVDKANLDPIFPPGYELSALPSVQDLFGLYLSRLDADELHRADRLIRRKVRA